MGSGRWQPDAVGSSGRARRVLVVEDDPDVRLIASLALGRIGGFDVSTAATAADGRALWSSALPDAILLDVELPDGDGLSLAREIATIQGENPVPIILLTGHAYPAPPPNVTAVIAKPFDAMSLAQDVRRICGWN